MALHLDYCASFGLSKQDMESFPETIGTFPIPGAVIIPFVANTSIRKRQHVQDIVDISSM